MQNFHDTFETRKQSFISAFSICMTAPLGLPFTKNWYDEKIFRILSLQHTIYHYFYQTVLLSVQIYFKLY